MTDTIISHLRDPVSAHKAIEHIWKRAKANLIAGRRMILELKPETRSEKQNRLLHAMLGDISRQMEWAGKRRDIDTWKRLLTAAWCRARGESVELLPALDGHGVDVVFRKTSQLTKAECVELCDFVAAWSVEHGIELRDAQQWIDPETGEICT